MQHVTKSEPAAAVDNTEQAEDVRAWTQKQRTQGKPAVEQKFSGAKSVVEEYGSVSKGVALKRNKRKKSSSTNKQSSRSAKHPKVVDEMTIGHPSN